MTKHFPADAGLVKTVHKEIVNGYEIRASLTRFGGIAVFVETPDYAECVWQGDNVLEAREYASRRAI